MKIYREQSADKQLTGVFKSPGYKNDFIIRKLLLILSKASKKLTLQKMIMNLLARLTSSLKKENTRRRSCAVVIEAGFELPKARSSDD